MGLRERASERRKRIVGNIALTPEEAERWDLEFWQKQGPQGRLSALMAIRADIAKIIKRPQSCEPLIGRRRGHEQ